MRSFVQLSEAEWHELERELYNCALGECFDDYIGDLLDRAILTAPKRLKTVRVRALSLVNEEFEQFLAS